MPETFKTESIAQISRAVRGLERAIDKLDEAVAISSTTQKRQIFKLITQLEERLEVNRAFLRHIRAADVDVSRPPDDAYKRLDTALANLQELEVETNSLRRVMTTTAALVRAVSSTRTEVSSRST